MVGLGGYGNLETRKVFLYIKLNLFQYSIYALG